VIAAPQISDLSRVRDERGQVVSVDELGGGIVELSVRLPRLAATVRAGEFAQLRCGDGPVPLLRRPMSVAWTEGEICGFVFERVGVGTRLLASLRAGDSLAALAPLGVGFRIPSGARRMLCVAGGLGCAPFPLLASQALADGVGSVTVLSGAATALRLYPAARYGRGDSRVEVLEATDDGSRGHAGLVTALVTDEIVTGADALYACGPNAMLVALAVVLRGLSGPLPPVVQASLEAPMGCGFGTCLGCALPVCRDGVSEWALCCREGPVMDMERVDWKALASLPPPDVA